ncbi:hypothetical protein SAMN05518672_1014 [Chitinophaga sp. CF118]|nr:hypothetical protein SAMN05518672_1014 [Chitinophaga sp. CF118]
MACSWFLFNFPGVGSWPSAFTNPLSYTQFGGVPSITPNGNTPQYIYASPQIIASVIRPTIDSALSNEILNAINSNISTLRVYLYLE